MSQMMSGMQPTGGYNFPQAPAGVMSIPPALSGGYYNQMAQMMAGPNYQMPHFQFTGLNSIAPGAGSGGPPNGNFVGNFNPNTGYGPGPGGPGSLGGYGFGGPGGGMGDIGGMGSYAPMVGGGGSYGNGNFPTSLTLGGGNVTGGYNPSSSGSKLPGILASLLGGAAFGGPGAILGQFAARLFGGNSSGTGGLTLPNGTTLPTQNMNLPPTSIPMPTQNINLAQPIINPVTGMPFGTSFFSTPEGQQQMKGILAQQNNVAGLQGESTGDNNFAQKAFGKGFIYAN